jgi:hypothetical protein
VEALSSPRPCACRCHDELTVEDRTQGATALFRMDDALRGWGYLPLYQIRGHALWDAAQKANDTAYRGVPLRDEECLYSRLVGSAVHEVLHALCGDPAACNYGMGFGLPYGVPTDVPPGDERDHLAPFNRAEARAWAGVQPFARALFGIDWTLRRARDVGTYCFAPGNSTVDVPPGFRAVGHVDRQRQPERYYALARCLEDEARAFFAAGENLADFAARFGEAERRGAGRRVRAWPDPAALARLPPRPYGRNDVCGCGSGKKWKKCCGA